MRNKNFVDKLRASLESDAALVEAPPAAAAPAEPTDTKALTSKPSFPPTPAGDNSEGDAPVEPAAVVEGDKPAAVVVEGEGTDTTSADVGVATEGLVGTAGGFVAGAVPVPGMAIGMGAAGGGMIGKIKDDIAKHKAELHELNAKIDAKKAEHHAANESEVTSLEDAAIEAIGVGKGAALGGFGGFLGTAYLGHKRGDKQKELEALQGAIKAKKEEMTKDGVSLEDWKGGLIGAAGGAGATYLGGPIGTAALGGVMGHQISKLDEHIDAHKKELAALHEKHNQHKGTTEDFGAEGVGSGAAIGALGGFIGTGYLGHKWQKRTQELAELDKQLHAKQKELSTMESVEASLESAMSALESLGTESSNTVSNTIKGALAGGLGGPFGTAYVGHRLEENHKELEKLKAEVADKRKTLAAMESAKASLEADVASTEAFEISAEGWKGGAKGAAWALLPGGAIVAGGVYGHKTDKLHAQIAEHKKELAELEDQHKASSEALEALGVEGAGGIAKGAALGLGFGAIGSGYMGHKHEQAKKELEELQAKIAAKKAAISSNESQVAALEHVASIEALEASTEGVGGAAGGAMAGLFGSAIAGPIGSGVVGGAYGHQIAELDKKIADRKAKLKELEDSHKASHESLEAAMAAEPPAANPTGGDTPVDSPLQPNPEQLVQEPVKEVEAATADTVAGSVASTEDEGGEPVVVEPVPAAVPVADEPIHEEPPVIETPAEGVEPVAGGLASDDLGDVAVVTDPSDLETQLIAAGDDEAAADQALSEANDLGEVAEGLESILTAIRAQPGGLEPSQAAWVSMGLEGYVGRFGLGTSLVPSVESFGGTTSRKEATASLEANIGEVIKNAWAYIVEMLKKFYEHAVAFLAKVFDGTKAMQERAKQLKAQAGTLAGSPKAAEIDVGGVAGSFSVDGKIPSNLSQVFTAIDAELKLVEEGTQVQMARGQQAGVALAAMVTVDDAGFPAAFEEAHKQMASGVKVPPLFKIKTGEGEFRTPTFPGEVFYTVSVPGGKFGTGRSNAAAAPSKLRTLSPAEIGQVCDAAVTLAAEVIAGRQGLNQGKVFLADMLIKSAHENTKLSEENRKKAVGLAKEFSSQFTAGASFILKAYGNLVKAGRGVLVVAEKSAAQYGPAQQALPAA